jgi:hypothetical protein
MLSKKKIQKEDGEVSNKKKISIAVDLLFLNKPSS